MINIKDKADCCGCNSCIQVCPRHCIATKTDKEGFAYPVVESFRCIDCGLCERVCPILNQNVTRVPVKTYAAKNPNETIRSKSSSGGIFTLLAEIVIVQGGVLFGARFDEDWNVIHDFTETLEGVAAFCGSKYVQSRIGDSYRRVEKFLKAGRKVLFSGTPCQVAGLKRFLRKEYDNLLIVDFVCHGVPSPKVWQMYLNETIARQGDGKNTVLSHSKSFSYRVKGIDFRSKSTGWKKYSFALTLSEASADGEENTVLLSSIFEKNPYMQAFLSDLTLRPSCYHCSAKSGKSGSDITIGDFWGIENVRPELDDDKGVSLVMVHSDKGAEALRQSSAVLEEMSYESALTGNRSISESVKVPLNRGGFFWRMHRSGKMLDSLAAVQNNSLFARVKRVLYRNIMKNQF